MAHLLGYVHKYSSLKILILNESWLLNSYLLSLQILNNSPKILSEIVIINENYM